MDYKFEDFEANAARAANAAPGVFSVSTIAAMSIAISLKRIADQLDGSAKGISLHDYARWMHDRAANNG